MIETYLTVQVLVNNKSFSDRMKSSNKFLQDGSLELDELITLPEKIKDLPRNTQVEFILWQVNHDPECEDEPMSCSAISLFDKNGELRQGLFVVRLWPTVFSDHNKICEYEDAKIVIDDYNDNIITPMEEYPILGDLDRLAKV